MSLLPSVFVSYARTDSHSIQYAVGLLEAGGAEVFRDIDDIGFGERWEDVITERINGCERVLVFWSKAAQQSEWVGREYKMALQLDKKLVPVMLDSTPLPVDLGAFHALTLAHFMPKTSPLKRYGGWVLGGVATTALAGVLGFELLKNESVELQSAAAPALNQPAEIAAAAEAIESDAARTDIQSFEQSVGVMIEAQAEEQNAQGLSAESAAEGSRHAGVDSANAVANATAQENTAAGAAARQDNAMTYHSLQRESTAAVAASKTPNIPAPAAPASIVAKPDTHFEISAASEPVNANETTEVNGAVPLDEGVPSAQLLAWIVGLLALLALGWLALRRYTHRDRAAGERFVERVFDDAQATAADKH